MTPQERQRMSPANHCYCNSKKGKAPLLYLKSRKAGYQGPSSPKHPQLLLSLRLMNHRRLRRAGERQSLRTWVCSAERLQELLCPASSHLIALSFRDSPILTCFLPASHCSTAGSHYELPFVPPPASIREAQLPLQELSYFIQFLNMMLLLTHFGQAVLKYTPTVT